MNWYFVKDGRRQGPVDEAEMTRLVANAEVRPDTLVWREGMAEWQRYDAVAPPAQVLSDPFAPVATAAPAAGTAAAAAAPFAATQRADRCSQCGRLLPAGEMARFGDVFVCADCKPLYVQRLREGVAPVAQMVYAGFWIRFGARLVDGLLLAVVNMIFYSPMIFMSMKQEQGQPPSGGFIAVTCVSYLLAFGFGIAYEVYFLGKSGATPGKKACNIKVVMADGGPLTYGRATGRYFAQMLSGFTLGIGYIIAAFDAEKRALHDHVCNTRVIRT